MDVEKLNPFDMLLEQIRTVVREEIKAANGNGFRDDRLIDASEAAKLLSVTEDWLYRHGKKLPFTRKLGHKMLRFSYVGIQRYLAVHKVP